MERRTLERRTLGTSAAVELASGELIPVEVIDISAGGVRASSPPALNKQAVVAVLLGGTRYPCVIAWTSDSEVGLTFTDHVGSDPVLEAVSAVMDALANRR